MLHSAAVGFGGLLLPSVIRAEAEQPGGLMVYIGTYTFGDSEGIYAYRLSDAGELHPLGLSAETVNPSFLAVAPTRQYLYAVNEVGSFEGTPGGALSAFAIDPESGSLSYINHQSTHGGAPCYVAVDNASRWALVANYSGGNVASFPIQEDGSLGQAACVVQHEGSSVNPQRQQAPHAHAIVLSPDGRFAFAPDLGIDKVMIYRLDSDTGQLTPNSQPYMETAPGAGPRHFAFHPSERFAYVINELNSTITAYAYDKNQGTLEETQTLSTLPEDFEGNNSCADIRISPDGRFLYGSNRGRNSIAMYRIDADHGRLLWIGDESTRGETPRNFNISPCGEWLLAANQNSNSIVVFKRNLEHGTLAPVKEIEAFAPVCVLFMPVSEE